jgi:hypothetical protein
MRRGLRAAKTVKRAMRKEGCVRQLPSRRSVVLKMTGSGEEIQVRSAEGAVEVRVTLTNAGCLGQPGSPALPARSPDCAVAGCSGDGSCHRGRAALAAAAGQRRGSPRTGKCAIYKFFGTVRSRACCMTVFAGPSRR